MPTFAKRAMRLTFSVAGQVAPRGTAKLAFRVLSLAPSRFPKGERARTVFAAGARRLAAAEPLPFKTPHGRIMAYRLRVAGDVPPSGKRFLVLHGWGSRSEYMAALAEGIANATGGEAILLDFPGHGASSGRFLDMRLAVETIAEAERRFGPFDGAVGHSFGGASLIVAASGLLPGIAPFRPGRLALIGAPAEMGEVFTRFGRKMGLSAAAQAQLEHEVQQVTGRRAGDFDIATASRDLALPVLIMHAEDDKEVSADHARRYAAQGSHVRLDWANGFGHRRIVAAPPVIAAVSAFMREEPEGKGAAA